jgi:uncharacterized protein
LSEAEFLAELVLRTGCGILFDINNLYVTAVNTQASAVTALSEFLRYVSPSDIAEIHLAGHAVMPSRLGQPLLIDHHGSNVCSEVWDLFQAAVAQIGPTPTLVEWDTNLPSFDALQAEAARVQSVLSPALEVG